ncbi:MAG: patatin-like phospholipase family protein [Ectothiorhodospiraceae bacterium]|nr:patatin-like phospholipase family protein [Ectothiorhodospiraceae bacterium]
MPKSDSGPTVSLVLGSGGARGLAHIGVIRWLEEHGYRIRSVVGCSMGALVGGVHAAGKLDEYERWARAITMVEVVSLIDLSWNRAGLVKGDRVIGTLTELVGQARIEDLPIPFTAVACELPEQKEVWIRSGPLFDAIRASISLPMFFTPVERNGAKLVDGGVLNPVPIAPTFGDETELTVAVNLGGAVDGSHEIERRAPAPSAEADSLRDHVDRFISRLRETVGNRRDDDWSAYDIAHQAFDAMQGTIARLKLAAYPPDVTVEIPRNACGLMEFDRAEEMIALGYERAARSLGRR